MNNLGWVLLASVLIVVAYMAGAASKCPAPVKPVDPGKPGLIVPGNHIIEGRAQLSYMGMGEEMHFWVGAYPKPSGIVQLILRGDSVSVVRDGKAIGSVGSQTP
jgi:hypothetical protein